MKPVVAFLCASLLLASACACPASSAEVTLDPVLKENCVKACNE